MGGLPSTTDSHPTRYGVCASSGIDPGESSITHLAGWSARTPIATIERTAALIDRLSLRDRGHGRPVSLAESNDEPAAARTSDAPGTTHGPGSRTQNGPGLRSFSNNTGNTDFLSTPG